MRAHLQSLYHSKFHPSFVSGIYQSCASCLPYILLLVFCRRGIKREFFGNEEITEQFPNMTNGPVLEVCSKVDTFRHKWSVPQCVASGLKGCCSKWADIGFQYFIINVSFLFFFFIKFPVICLLWEFFFYTHHFKFRLLNTCYAFWKLRCFALQRVLSCISLLENYCDLKMKQG